MQKVLHLNARGPFLLNRSQPIRDPNHTCTISLAIYCTLVTYGEEPYGIVFTGSAYTQGEEIIKDMHTQGSPGVICEF